MRLEDVMTRDLPAVSPEDSVREAARRMAASGVKALPVCAADGRLLGILTDWDVTLAAARDSNLGEMRIAEVMTADVVTASPRTTLDEASELMGDRRLHHLCISEDGRFQGMVHLDVEWAQLGGLGAQAPMATFAARV